MTLDRDKLIKYAESQYHKPYKLRSWLCEEVYSKDPKDFDCSAYILWCYFKLGFKLPRTSSWQYAFCQSITPKERKPGDLYFLERNGRVFHVGMYIGAGMCIEAAGGRAGKVIRSFADKNENKSSFIGWKRVPLEKAEDDFFIWVAAHPLGKCKKDEILQ